MNDNLSLSISISFLIEYRLQKCHLREIRNLLFADSDTNIDKSCQRNAPTTHNMQINAKVNFGVN